MKKKDRDIIDPIADPLEWETDKSEVRPETDRSTADRPASQPASFPLPEPVAEITPSIIGATKEVPLRKGYVFIKKIGKDSIIQVAQKQVGTIFKTDEWEVLSDKKK